MSRPSSALELDAADEPIQAIHAYERAIEEALPDLETYLNLVGLYLAINDYGFAAYHRVPQELISRSVDTARRVLDLAEHRFGSRPMINLWRLLLEYDALGDDAARESAADLIAEHPMLKPYSPLFGLPLGEDWRESAALLEELRNQRTERARYVSSTIEAALRHQNRIL